MKKLFLSLIAVVVGTMGCFAQDDLVATLSHGSNLSTYTGADALSEAYTAAVEGDVITLSPGVFNAVDIEKAITVRGAGMMPLESNGYVSTQISGAFTVNVPSNTIPVLTIEGVHALGDVTFNGSNLVPVTLLKSRFEAYVTGFGVSLTACSCIFAYNLTAKRYSSINKNTTINCLKCVIVNAESEGTYEGHIAKIIATNCVVELGTNPNCCLFTNCIIISRNAHGAGNCPLLANCSAQNCIGINSEYTTDLFENISTPSNVMVEGVGTAAYTSVFKTLTSLGQRPAMAETYELTETAATTYLGDDGTQVGIYGGTNPFNPTPTNTLISRFTVNSNVNNGNLSVTINVE